MDKQHIEQATKRYRQSVILEMYKSYSILYQLTALCFGEDDSLAVQLGAWFKKCRGRVQRVTLDGKHVPHK